MYEILQKNRIRYYVYVTLCKNVKKWSNASQKDETILGQNFSAGLYSIGIVYVHRMDGGEYQLML